MNVKDTAKRPIGRPEGGTLKEKVRIDASKSININGNFEMPTVQVKEVDNHNRKFYCCMCGRSHTTQKGNFPTGGASPLWKGNNGYLPFCKACCDALMSTMTNFYSGNEEHALRHLCSVFDWYYCEEASAMTLAQVQAGKSRLSIYPSKMCTRQVATKGETFLDTIRDECDSYSVVTAIPDVQSQEDDEDADFIVTKEIVKRWGCGYKPDQYQFLEEEFKDWCTRNVCNTKSQQEIYKNIAIAQLNIRIAQQNGGGKLVDAMKALQDLMNSANILPRQTAENVLADTQTFGTLLKKFEETRPIPEPAPEWRDVDNIRKYQNTWFRGGLGKALKIKNENTDLYDEAMKEMERYTVKRESFTNSAEGMGATVFDEKSQSDGGDADASS